MNIEEFVNDYLQEHRHDVLLNPYNGLIDFANAYKEQMMKEAVAGEIYEEDNSPDEGTLHAISHSLSKDKYKFMDKVHIIIVKEEVE